MKILVINAGSSSVKYQLFDMENETVLAKGICERIGIEGGAFKHKVPGREDFKLSVDMKNHSEAIKLVVDTLVSKENGVIESMKEIDAVGHRVLHGGEKFSGSVVINDDVIKAIEDCCELGPLHNPHNLTGIHACEEIMGKDVPQVAVFDTGFHQTIAKEAFMYALPYEYYEKHGIRRYGFHGTSHRYISKRTTDFLMKKYPGKYNADTLRVVTCHLGNGSSLAAVKGGKCVDTTMGLTPLEGIMMGTRSGSIDPAIIPFLMEKEGLTAQEVDTILNKKSGMLGLTSSDPNNEATSDNRTIEGRAKAGDERAMLVEAMFCHQLTKLIGGFIAEMGGADVVVFTGGIGENNPHYRSRVAAKFDFLGVTIDEEANSVRGEEIEISTEDSALKFLVIPTDEELMIAQDTYEITQK